MSLAGEERKQQILNMLQLQGKVRTPELVEKLEVSSETVRRYLEELEQERPAQAGVWRGGKGECGAGIRSRPTSGRRGAGRSEEKRRMGQAAADLIQDKDVVVLDDGTTTVQMIDMLVLKKQLTVLVTSIHALNLLISYKSRGIFDGEIVFIGGRVNSRHYRTSGTLAMHFMSNFHVDKAFIVADGLQIDSGVTCFEDDRAMLGRVFLKQANRQSSWRIIPRWARPTTAAPQAWRKSTSVMLPRRPSAGVGLGPRGRRMSTGSWPTDLFDCARCEVYESEALQQEAGGSIAWAYECFECL